MGGLKALKPLLKLTLPNLLVINITVSTKKAVSITVRGKVQGVGFRYFTKSTAKRLGLVGYVKNIPDGSVYVEAYGNSKSIERLISKCHEGSWLAAIKNIEVKEIGELYETEFRIEK